MSLSPLPLLRQGPLLLRAFDEADAAAFAAAVVESAPEMGQWMPWCHAGYSVADALDWFAACRQAAQAGTAQEFGVFDAASGRLLGGAGLNAIHPLHRWANLGYWVRRSARRQGVALGCVQALAAQAFGPLGLFRVEIVVAVGNEPSVAVARRAGAQFEAVARHRLCLHGAPVDASVFSLIPGA